MPPPSEPAPLSRIPFPGQNSLGSPRLQPPPAAGMAPLWLWLCCLPCRTLRLSH